MSGFITKQSKVKQKNQGRFQSKKISGGGGGAQPRLESLFSAHGRYFAPSNLRAKKNYPCIAPHLKWHIFHATFLNSARFIGSCAHGSLLSRRSLARTTYFSAWVTAPGGELEERESGGRSLRKFVGPRPFLPK